MEKLFSVDTQQFSRAINLHRTKTTYLVKAGDRVDAESQIKEILEEGEEILRLTEVVFDERNSPVFLTVTDSLESVGYEKQLPGQGPYGLG